MRTFGERGSPPPLLVAPDPAPSPGVTEELCPRPHDQRRGLPGDSAGVGNATKRAAGAARGAGGGRL